MLEMVDISSLFPVVFEIELDDTFGGILDALSGFASLLQQSSFVIRDFKPPFDTHEAFTFLLLELDVHVQGLEALRLTIYMLLSLQVDFLVNILNIGQTAQVSSQEHSLVSYGRQRCLPVLVVLSHRSWLRLEGGILQVFRCACILKRVDALLSLLDLRFGLNGFAEHDGLLERKRLIPTIVFDTDSKLVLFVHDFVHLVYHVIFPQEECGFVD